MINDLYRKIFDIPAKDFVLEGVKHVGGGETKTGDSFEFVAVISAQAPIQEFIPTDAELSKTINYSRRALKDVAGPDLVVPVKWEVTVDGEKKKKMFNFAGSINPMTVFGFEIVGGRYFIKVLMFGMFY
jgi:hypothetical protein